MQNSWRKTIPYPHLSVRIRQLSGDLGGLACPLKRVSLLTLYCLSDTLKVLIHNLSISPDSLVLPIPPQETVHFSPQFNGTFSCHAKENVTLKFRRIQNSKKVEYFLNLSSEFGFQALVHFQEADLRDGSVVSCLTIGQGSPLHIWTVSLTSSKQGANQSLNIL